MSIWRVVRVQCRAHNIAVCVLVFAVAAVWGCTYERVVYDGWADFGRLADPKGDAPQVARPSMPTQTPPAWAIHLYTLGGEHHQAEAAELINQLRATPGLSDLWAHVGDGGTAVYQGRYHSPTDPIAAQDLLLAQSAVINGGRLFEQARLISLDQPADTSQPLTPSTGYDLRPFAGMYSLQIAYYDDEFGKDFRDAAEQAVTTLRGDGVEAYYYHGPHRSMVTVGLFTDGDFVQEGVQRVYGPRIRALQETYPYNLGNGRTLIQKIGGQDAGEQASFLVRVPG